MEHRQTAGLIVAIFVILAILGTLSAIAIPHADRMIYRSQAEERETEFLKVQNAVTEMLRESPCGALVSMGPTADLNEVRTADPEPLVLADYLCDEKGRPARLECMYGFTSDGIVIQRTN